MRKAIMFLGTILIATVILISGSAVATWYYANYVIDYDKCRNPYYAVDAPDGYYATLGVETPYQRLGWILLDLGSGNEMGPDQNFTVFASSYEQELYKVSISEEPDYETTIYIGQGRDDMDQYFFTPLTPDKSWRYILLEGFSGSYTPLDPYYGPEIDAVGWED
jgi:hypothetical protein